MALAVLPNGVFWLLAPLLQQSRALVNIDYALLATLLLAVPLPRGVVGGLMSLLLLLDAWMAYSTLYLPRPWELAEGAMTVLAESPVFAAACLLVLVGASLGAAALARVARSADRARRHAALLLALVGGVALLDWSNGTAGASLGARAAWFQRNLGTSGGGNFTRMFVAGLRLANEAPVALPDGEFASSSLERLATIPAADVRVLLVLVESWGLPRDSTLARRLEQALTDSISGAAVSHGTVPAVGGTLGGEFRELCGARFRAVQVDSTFARGCLPRRLQARGVRTVAMHAYRARLYGRDRWYAPLGFSERRFVDELRRPGQAICGITLRGPCDWDVAPLVSARMVAAERDGTGTLIYWLTLSGHLPIVASDAMDTCPGASELARDRQLCGWFTVTQRTLAAIGGLARQHPRWTVLVVGDHEPPFGAHASAAFVARRVPWVRLDPPAEERVRPAR